MDFISRAELFGIGRQYVLSRATKVNPAQVDTAGSDVNLMVGGGSVVAYAIVLQLIQAFNALTLDGAKGDDLDRYALDRYGQQLPRKGAAAALGVAVFSRTNGNNAAGTIDAGTILLSQAGYSYVTLQPASFTTATGLPSDTVCAAPIRATQAGALFQAGTNTITAFQAPNNAVAFDTSVTVNNPVTTAGGADAEDDPTYRARIRTFWLTARRGILAAIEQGATSVAGVASAHAFEFIGALGQPVRLISLSIADPTGVANDQLTAAVVTALNDYRAAGIQVIVSPGTPLIVLVALSLTFVAGVDAVALRGAVQAAVANYVNGLAVGAPLRRAAILSVLQRFVQRGLIVTDTTLVAPVGDLVPAAGQTIRTRLADIVFV